MSKQVAEGLYKKRILSRGVNIQSWVALALLAPLFIILFAKTISLQLAVALGITLLIIGFFAAILPHKTAKGVELKRIHSWF